MTARGKRELRILRFAKCKAADPTQGRWGELSLEKIDSPGHPRFRIKETKNAVSSVGHAIGSPNPFVACAVAHLIGSISCESVVQENTLPCAQFYRTKFSSLFHPQTELIYESLGFSWSGAAGDGFYVLTEPGRASIAMDAIIESAKTGSVHIRSRKTIPAAVLSANGVSPPAKVGTPTASSLKKFRISDLLSESPPFLLPSATKGKLETLPNGLSGYWVEVNPIKALVRDCTRLVSNSFESTDVTLSMITDSRSDHVIVIYEEKTQSTDRRVVSGMFCSVVECGDHLVARVHYLATHADIKDGGTVNPWRGKGLATLEFFLVQVNIHRTVPIPITA